MNTNQVPQEISALIEYAEEELGKKELQAKEKSLQEEIKRVAVRREETEECVAGVASLIPDVIFPFVNLSAWVNDVEEYGGNRWSQYVRFDVPDLAPFALEFKAGRADESPKLVAWIVAGVSDGYFDEDGEYEDARYSFTDRYSSRCEVDETELRFVLVAAKRSAEYLLEAQERKAGRIQQKKRSDEMRETRQAQEKVEEQSLFDALKTDDVALALLKAFVLLRDERSHFESRLDEADAALYSVENRWSRRADELRRQADEIQRRADDDRMRLQSDITDAESKIKQLERGW